MSDARLILTCGLHGAGKTTLAVQLAADRNAVRLTKNEWLWSIGSSPWDRSTGEKMEQELWRHAQELLGLGLSVVLDFGLWARAERDEKRAVARGLGVGVELYYVDAPLEDSGAESSCGTPRHHGTLLRFVAPTSRSGRTRSEPQITTSSRCSMTLSCT